MRSAAKNTQQLNGGEGVQLQDMWLQALCSQPAARWAPASRRQGWRACNSFEGPPETLQALCGVLPVHGHGHLAPQVSQEACLRRRRLEVGWREGEGAGIPTGARMSGHWGLILPGSHLWTLLNSITVPLGPASQHPQTGHTPGQVGAHAGPYRRIWGALQRGTLLSLLPGFVPEL